MTLTMVFFIGLGIVLVALVIGLWRYWQSLTQTGNDDEEFEQRLARLNERQTNRFSDDELTTPLSDDDAWERMVKQGRRGSDSPSGRRYNGGFQQRADERRRRDAPPR
jgi:hypothetical protein